MFSTESPRSFHSPRSLPQVARCQEAALRAALLPPRRPGVIHGVTPPGSVLTPCFSLSLCSFQTFHFLPLSSRQPVFKVFLLRCKGFYLFLLKVGVIVHCHRQYHAGWPRPKWYGSDNMPAHAKCIITGVSINIPITDGRLNLGTWQGNLMTWTSMVAGSKN